MRVEVSESGSEGRVSEGRVSEGGSECGRVVGRASALTRTGLAADGHQRFHVKGREVGCPDLQHTGLEGS